MKLKKDIRSVTYLKSNAAQLLEEINTTHRPVIITQNGEARAVVQDPESFERMKTAIGMLKLLAMAEHDIVQQKVTEQEDVFKQVSESLARRKP